MSTSRPAVRRPDAGISLIETMVALTVLSLTLMGVGPMMLTTARGSTVAGLVAERNMTMAAVARRYGVLTYSQLAAGTTCQTVSAPPFPNTTCTTITTVSSSLSRITIVVTPATTPTIKADTVMIDRANLVAYNPLNNP